MWLFRSIFGLFFFVFLCQPQQVVAQTDSLPKGGGWSLLEVVDGDTIYSMSLRQIVVTAKRTFKTTEERSKYHLYRRCAEKVYPYAVQGIDLYKDIQEETAEMKKKDKKKHIKKINRELKEDFKDQMKNLTKTQGYILIKMVERQTGKPFYDIIKETRGGFTATYWNELGKLNGYHLKDGYQLGKDPLLDEILLEFDFGDSIYKY